MFTLGVRDTPASSVKHLLFPLCVCFDIVPDNLFGSSCHPPLSTVVRQASVLICLNPMLQTTLVRSLFHFVLANFRQFCRFLERMKTDDANPETFVLFAYALCSSISGTGPLRH